MWPATVTAVQICRVTCPEILSSFDTFTTNYLISPIPNARVRLWTNALTTNIGCDQILTIGCAIVIGPVCAAAHFFVSKPSQKSSEDSSKASSGTLRVPRNSSALQPLSVLVGKCLAGLRGHILTLDIFHDWERGCKTRVKTSLHKAGAEEMDYFSCHWIYEEIREGWLANLALLSPDLTASCTSDLTRRPNMRFWPSSTKSTRCHTVAEQTLLSVMPYGMSSFNHEYGNEFHTNCRSHHNTAIIVWSDFSALCSLRFNDWDILMMPGAET